MFTPTLVRKRCAPAFLAKQHTVALPKLVLKAAKRKEDTRTSDDCINHSDGDFLRKCTDVVFHNSMVTSEYNYT